MVDWSGYNQGPNWQALVQSNDKAVNSVNAGMDTAFEQGLKRDQNARAWDENSRAWDQNARQWDQNMRANAVESRAAQLFPFQLSEEQHKSIARADDMLGTYAQILEGAKNPDGTVDQNKWNLFRQRAQQAGISMPWIRGDDPQGDYERTVVVTEAAADKARIARQMSEANLAILQDKSGAQWGHIGTDALGQPQYGWVDSVNKKVTPYASQGSSANLRTDLHGEEFLRTLDPLLAGQLRAIYEGREAYPANPRTPQQFALARLMAQAYPGADATFFNERNKTRQSFASGGVNGKTVIALNQAIGHLANFYDAGMALNNYNFLPGITNRVANTVAGNLDGDFQARAAKFEVARKAVTDEVLRAFKGAGATVHEMAGLENVLNSNSSPEAIKGYVEMAVHLLHSRLSSLTDSYNDGMRTNNAPVSFLKPDAREKIAKLPGGKEFLGNDGGHQAATPQGTAAKYRATNDNGVIIESDDGKTWRRVQ